MANIPPDITETIWILKRELVQIINAASQAEYILFERFGETDRTIYYLDQLKNVTEQADQKFAQFSTMQRRIAGDQPNVNSDMLKLVTETIAYTQARLPAWVRSIEEIKNDWSLL